MKRTPNVAVVLGTRPEAIKLAPVIAAFRARDGIAPFVISTGQHREMLQQALQIFDLKPNLDLEIMRPAQSLQELTCRGLQRLQSCFHEVRPDVVVVQGDTTTAFCAALAAFYEKIPVAHVEAGLRSDDRYSPYPEEMNRRLVDQLSSLLFAPTDAAKVFLLRDGFRNKNVFVTGNTVVDALLFARARARREKPAIEGLDDADLLGRKMILVTAHRRESFGGAFTRMCHALRRIADEHPETVIVYPVHLNPNVDGPVRALLGHHPRIKLLPPVGYIEFVSLLDRADIVMTDSGGVQEEAPTFAKPILVLREVTERPEGIAAGVARLVGTDEERIVSETLGLLRDPARYAAMATGNNPYGDGHAAERIATIISDSIANGRLLA